MAGMFVPQMVAPLDTTQIFANIGKTYKEAGEGRAIRRALSDLNPEDPASLSEVQRRLYPIGGNAVDIADRLGAVARGIENRTYERGLAKDELGRKLEDRETFRGAMQAQPPGRSLADVDQEETGAPATRAPNPTAAPAAAPQERSKWWSDEDMAPAQLFNPQAAQVGAPAGGPIRPIPVQGAPPAAPADAQAVVEQGAGLPTPAPQYAEARAPAPAVERPGPTAAPRRAAPQGGGQLPAVGVPGRAVTAASPSQRELDIERYVQQQELAATYAPNAQAAAAIRARIDRYRDEAKEIGAQRQKASEAGQDIQKQVTTTDIKSRGELLEHLGKERLRAQELNGHLDSLDAIVASPGYYGGPGVQRNQRLARLGLEIDSTLRFLTGNRLSLPVDYYRNVNSQIETAKSLSNKITRLTLGTMSAGTSDKDVAFVKDEGVNIETDPESARRIILMHKASNERIKQMHEIAFDGARLKMSHEQIQRRLRKFGEETPMFINKDGTLTELGRQVAPNKAKQEDEAAAAKAQNTSQDRSKVSDKADPDEGRTGTTADGKKFKIINGKPVIMETRPPVPGGM